MTSDFSVSSICGTLQPFANKPQFTRASNLGKTLAVSFFVGTQLLAIPFSERSGEGKLIRNYSPATCINYVGLDGSKEIDFLNNSLFLDLLKIENLKKLECMSTFQEDWNGVGGQAFSDASISIFKDIIENVCKQPNIAPTGRGSLLLQYELDDRSVLAFEVRQNRIEMVCVPMGDYSSATSKVFTDDFIRQINSQVAQFYGLELY
ncbi:MAG: hypothetical protein ACI4EX_01025 [Lachnospiraceae bacterium]